MRLTKVIVTAMKEEADIIINRFNLKETKKLKNLVIFEWERENEWEKENIVLALTGIGKIGAAIGTSYIFENYQVDKLLNIGIAGSLGNIDVRVGDVFLPNTFIQHDMYLPFEGAHLDYAKAPIFLEYAIGENLDLNKFGLVMNGVCLTGDQFIDNEEKVNELREDHGADLCEMEAFSILSVAREYDALDKCVVIKAVSDGANSEAKDTHMDNLEFAMNNSVDVLELIL